MKMRIAAVVAALSVALTFAVASPASASIQTGWQERKYAQTVLKEVWRYQTTARDRAIICEGWRNGLGWMVQEPIVEVMMEQYVSYKDAVYVTRRFFDSACYA